MKKLFILFAAALALTIVGVANAQYPDADDTLTVFDLQGPLSTAVEGNTYWFEDLVVTGLRENGIWVSDQVATATAFTGVFVYMGGSPAGYVPGDMVDILGEYIEYYDWTELRAYGSLGYVTDVGSAVVPTPALLTCCDINDSLLNTEAEKWEGVLVQVDSVRVRNDSIGYGTWVVEEFDADAGCAAVETLQVDDESYAPVSYPETGDSFTTLTGCLDYTYGYYKLQPRTNADLVFVGLPPAPVPMYAFPLDDTHIGVEFDRELDQTSAELVSNYYIDSPYDITINSSVMNADEMGVVLTTSDMSGFADPDSVIFRTLVIQNIENKEGVAMTAPGTEDFIPGVRLCEFAHVVDSADVAGMAVCIGGVVTGAPNETFMGRNLFYQDRATAFGYGLYSYTGNYADDIKFDVERGDSILISGLVYPRYQMLQMGVVNNIEIVTTGLTPSAPAVVSLAAAQADAYEGKLVRFENVRVHSDSIGYGLWTIDDGPVGTDTLAIEDAFSPGIDVYEPAMGDSFDFMIGPIWFQYSFYKINPRDTQDLGIVGLSDVAPGDAPRFVNSLDQNRPNPFNPTTTIAFTIEKPSFAILKIFDVAGRHVRTLHKGDLNAGTFEATWDGRNNSGKDAVSGVYFYRLEASDYTSTRKMMLVR